MNERLDHSLPQIVEALNATARPYRQCVRVHELFEAQVSRSPRTPALEFCGAQISYEDLNARANRLARHLRTLGVAAGTHVGICADRSFELMVGILAVLKAGAGFVPLDPEYPDDRLSYMLTDCAAAVVLTTRATASRVPPSGAVVVEIDTLEPQLSELPDDNLSTAGSPEDVAYTLYTSGSTGRPKGVLVPHRGISNHMQWVCDELQLGPSDRLLQFTSISFDAAMLELLAPLHCGSMLVLASPGGHRDPAYLLGAIREHRITVFQLVPSLLRV
ncbi:MAG: AMP-binding protein, partial [Methylibium sp.]